MTTYYTYNEDTKQLTPVKRVLVRDGKTMILGNPADFAKYLNAYPRDEASFTPPQVDAEFCAVPDGYELKDGKWVCKWRVEELPPPPPRTFDKYRLVCALQDANMWTQIKEWLLSHDGAYDRYLAAKDVSEDEPLFKEGVAEAKKLLGWTDKQVAAVLDAAEIGAIR